MPRTQDAYLKWHDNLKTNVALNTPGATAADAAMLAADNTDLHAKAAAAAAAENASKAAHASLGAALSASQANARALAGRIKKSAGYTTAIGDTLQLEGAENSVAIAAQKPALTVVVKAGGVVEVSFGKLGGLVEGVHLYGLRDGEGVFTYLASETHSPYVDNRPLLVAGKPETRNYKAMFFTGKTEVGLQSDVAQATARP